MTENQRRKFLKLVGAAGIGMALSGVSCSPRHDFTEIKNPTREELVKRLKKLAESKAPNDLAYGAMCYQVEVPFYEEKPCPDCDGTLETGKLEATLREYNVPLKRIQAQGVDAKLVLPEHCPTCGLGLLDYGMDWQQRGKLTDEQREAKKPHLEIKYPDVSDPIRVELDSAFDLEIMALFLQGKDRYLVGIPISPILWKKKHLSEQCPKME